MALHDEAEYPHWPLPMYSWKVTYEKTAPNETTVIYYAKDKVTPSWKMVIITDGTTVLSQEIFKLPLPV
jgi:hypothetical protein